MINSHLCIHHLIEQQATQNPDDIAIVFNNAFCSYRQLNTLSSQLAHYLIQKYGINTGDYVPVHAQKSINLIITILAILKIGAIYIPIHEDAPPNTLKTILNHTQSTFFCTNIPTIIDTMEHSTAIALQIDQIIHASSFTNISISFYSASDNNALAYIIYTSGTTGYPKGVMVSHKNLVSTYLSWKEVYHLSQKDVHLQMAPCAFDVFFGDFVRALCSGAKLVLCEKKTLLSPTKLSSLIISQNVSCAEFVPSILRILIKHLKKYSLQLPKLRLLICGSDLWTVEEYKQIKQFLDPNTRLINSYGLTEATIDSTFFEADLEDLKHYDPNIPVPIGKPFPNTTIYILGTNRQPVLSGETGEIYIGGAGISLGYFKQSELTHTHFITNDDPENTILYRTGDLGKWLPDGNLQFIGRNNVHIKIRGQRVELPALEKLLNQHPKIQTCLAYSFTNTNQKTAIGCFLLLNQAVTFAEVSNYIKKHLPSYYVPNKMYEISEISLNQNGKIDRNIIHQKIINEFSPLPVQENQYA